MGETATPYDDMARAEAVRQGVDPNLAVAILHQESGGNPKAYNPSGATGLMQLLPATGRALGATDLYDPAQNAKAGVAYLKQGLDQYGGNYAMTAARYFGGPDQKQWGPKTHKYVKDIADRYVRLAADSPAQPPKAPANTADDFIAQQLSAADETTPDAKPDTSADGFIAKQLAGVAADELKASDYAGESMLEQVGNKAADIGGQIAGGIGQGAAAGFGSAPLLDTNYWPGSPNAPAYSQTIDAVANNTIGPVFSLAGRGLNALVGGAQGGLNSAGNMLDPSGRLGPDLAAAVTMPPIPEIGMAAAARGGAPGAIGTAEAPTLPPPGATMRLEPPMSRVANDGSLSAAATPHELTTMTPGELAAAEAGDNLKRLSEGGKTVAPSAEIYVPGSEPLPAEYGSVEDATNHRALVSKNPAYNQFVTDRMAQNNDARLNYYGDLMGSPETVQANHSILNEEFDNGLKTVMANKQPADPQAVVQTVTGILEGPDGKRAAVEKAMESVLGSLKNRKTAALETDPSLLYGVRQHINDIISPEALRESPMSGRAVAALMQVKASLDGVIEAAAPGFQDLMKQYSDAKAPIDAMEYLQAKLPSLMNAGVLSAPKFRNFMRDIYNQRKAGGILPATKLSTDQLQALWNIDSDLQRSTRLSLGMGLGSNTGQNLASFARMAGEGALHSAASMLPLGNIGLSLGKGLLKASKEQKIINKLTGK